MILRRRYLGVLLLLLVWPAFAVIETYEFSDPQLEERYHDLSQELRCPKCQNQNIADSNAPISEDLRKLLYRQLEAGASDREILQDMVNRYGEFVRYRPGFDAKTAVLWLGPLAFLVIGGLFAFLALRGRSRERDDQLTEGERARLDKLLAARAEQRR
ncbi:MAG: cytochrome c-type biogenesis protein [Chromatocurvus sp.]